LNQLPEEGRGDVMKSYCDIFDGNDEQLKHKVMKA
jgi:hypothetical protein